MMKETIDLVIDYPANIATQLINNEIDIGLIPVAVLPQLKEYHVISDFCIAADGAVASVCLFSDVPLNEIKIIFLDYQSRTSVALLKILLKKHWKISPVLVQASEGYENNISGTTAGLVIGDRALQQRLKSTLIYDLSLAWEEMTGKPFVFAAWISNKQMTTQFIAEFNQANKFGLDNLLQVVKENAYSTYDLNRYYTENIKFKPQFDILAVITLFLEKTRLIAIL